MPLCWDCPPLPPLGWSPGLLPAASLSDSERRVVIFSPSEAGAGRQKTEGPPTGMWQTHTLTHNLFKKKNTLNCAQFEKNPNTKTQHVDSSLHSELAAPSAADLTAPAEAVIRR